MTGTARGVARTLAADPGVNVLFSARSDGNLSHIVGGGDATRARTRLLTRAGLDLDDAVFMEQVHGADVARVGPEERGRGARARADAVSGVDALVTDAAEVALVVLVADCVPLLLADRGRAVAAVHAGREGVRAGVVAAGLEALAPQRPDAVEAVIGPAIGGCCYELPEELCRQVTAVVPAAAATTTEGRPSLDLRAAVSSQLRAAGVRRIRDDGGCTRCDPSRWFSHRAAPDGDWAGRQAGVIWRSTGADVPHRSRAAASLHS